MKHTRIVFRNSLSIIGVANGSGGRFTGCEKAATVMKNSKLLKQCDVAHTWKTVVEENRTGSGLMALKGIQKMNIKLAAHVSQTLLNNEDVLVIGGDHSCAIGTWSGVAFAQRKEGDIGLIWIDAHLDSHQPHTSETGNIHGMPAAHLLGHGATELRHIADERSKIRPENLAFIGTRSYESHEKEYFVSFTSNILSNFLESIGVRIFYMDEVRRRGIEDTLNETIRIVSKNTIGFGFSIDIDAFAVCDSPAVGTPEPGGIQAQQLIEAIRKHDLKRLLATEIVEFIPEFDGESHISEQLIVRLIEAIYERKFSNYRLNA